MLPAFTYDSRAAAPLRVVPPKVVRIDETRVELHALRSR